MDSLSPVFGIDVSKRNLLICLLSSGKEKYFTVVNDGNAFDRFLKDIETGVYLYK